MIERRVRKARSRLRSGNLDALLITTPESVRYYTGFTGSEALLLLTKDRNFLVVDSRYTSQSRSECRDTITIEAKDKIGEILRRTHKWGARRVGFESERLSVAQYRGLKKTGAIELIPVPEGLEGLRSVKDPGEIKLLKVSAAISSKGFSETVDDIKVGMEEREIAWLLELNIRNNGAEATPFPFVVASGRRGALPHGKASGKRIRGGEFVTLDFGAVYQGYCSDETCTVIMGKPTKKQKRVYQAVKDAHDRAIDVVRPGVKARRVDSAARRVIEKAGLGKYFRHGTGHGVGLAVHEEPRIAPGQDVQAEVGMVFTIEPGVYIPGWGGVRIEDLIRVTRQGCELLSSAPKELRRI